jgi:predicted RNA-binding Zn ribbon-like protein
MSQIDLGHYMHSSYAEFIRHGHGKYGPWFDLVNSEEWDTYGNRIDHFHNPAWLPFFVRRWKFRKPQESKFPVASWANLRNALRGICQAAAAGKAIAVADLHALNQAMSVSGKQQLAQGQNGLQLEFVTEASGWKKLLAETAKSFADLLSQGELARIKICRSPECRWVFYDQTKAKSRCWCDDKICGNRARVRRSRMRQLR